MDGVAVLIRKDGHRLGAELVQGTEGSHCDLTTIGHQDLAEHALPEPAVLVLLLSPGGLRLGRFLGCVHSASLTPASVHRTCPVPSSGVG